MDRAVTSNKKLMFFLIVLALASAGMYLATLLKVGLGS
jgi:hypothetical protein